MSLRSQVRGHPARRLDARVGSKKPRGRDYFAISQINVVPSSQPTASRWLSGLKAIGCREVLPDDRTRIFSPVPAFHKLTLLPSFSITANNLPSGEKSTDRGVLALCFHTTFPSLARTTTIIPELDANAIRELSGLVARAIVVKSGVAGIFNAFTGSGIDLSSSPVRAFRDSKSVDSEYIVSPSCDKMGACSINRP